MGRREPVTKLRMARILDLHSVGGGVNGVLGEGERDGVGWGGGDEVREGERGTDLET
jgi:hypothetical protein